MSVETGDKISRIYTGFRGVDFRGEEINLVRSPDSLNVWKDYKETESIRTRPDLDLHTSFTDTIYGIFFFGGSMIVHSGTNLYKVVGSTKTQLYAGVKAAKSDGFIYDNKWYFKDGEHYLVYNGMTIGEVEGYIPTTSIGRKPSGGGTIYEDVNMLTGWRINTFLADGEYKKVEKKDEDGNVIKDDDGKPVTEEVWEGSTEYYLDSRNIDSDATLVVKVNDKVTTDYTVDYEAGKITFAKAPSAPLTDGRDNVSIQFKKTIAGYADNILKCTMLQVFDNRVFVSGNPDYQNMVWHCSLNDPTYFSDTDYYAEGFDDSAVKGIIAGNNALWVFREPSQSNTTVFYHTPTVDSTYGKIYPSVHSSIATGCIGKAINFNDDIVFFSERGMEGISGDVTTEQAVAHRSTLVDRKLTSATNYKDMVLEEWEGYLFVFIGNKAFLADSRSMFANGNHSEYEWFYWEFRKNITCARVEGGIMYLGTSDGVVYTLTNTKNAVESYWVTPKDKFGSPNKQKTTNKRGCVVEATGDISVYAKTDKSDFELIEAYKGITDSFVSRIKRKKFKDLQLKFYSQTRFSLETATLEVFVGGYIKR